MVDRLGMSVDELEHLHQVLTRVISASRSTADQR
jgi:hypothetical protein